MQFFMWYLNNFPWYSSGKWREDSGENCCRGDKDKRKVSDPSRRGCWGRRGQALQWSLDPLEVLCHCLIRWASPRWRGTLEWANVNHHQVWSRGVSQICRRISSCHRGKCCCSVVLKVSKKFRNYLAPGRGRTSALASIWTTFTAVQVDSESKYGWDQHSTPHGDHEQKESNEGGLGSAKLFVSVIQVELRWAYFNLIEGPICCDCTAARLLPTSFRSTHVLKFLAPGWCSDATSTVLNRTVFTVIQVDT